MRASNAWSWSIRASPVTAWLAGVSASGVARKGLSSGRSSLGSAGVAVRSASSDGGLAGEQRSEQRTEGEIGGSLVDRLRVQDDDRVPGVTRGRGDVGDEC